MNRYFVVFIVISALALGAIFVYTRANIKTPGSDTIRQELSKFGSQSSPTKNPMPQITELKIEDERQGTGSAVKNGDTVEVNYLGTLLDGTKFDSSYDRGETFSFEVGSGTVIEGWEKGLLDMKVGGKRKLIIPSSMAYGDQGVGGIPPNSPLIFEIELVGIK